MKELKKIKNLISWREKRKMITAGLHRDALLLKEKAVISGSDECAVVGLPHRTTNRRTWTGSCDYYTALQQGRHVVLKAVLSHTIRTRIALSQIVRTVITQLNTIRLMITLSYPEIMMIVPSPAERAIDVPSPSGGTSVNLSQQLG